MNKFFKMACLALAVIIVMGNGVPADPQPSTGQSQQFFLNYTWFYDEELTDPVGTCSDVNVELNRLRALHGGYTFSAYPAMNLYEFEYGYYPFYTIVTIYSDLQ